MRFKAFRRIYGIFRQSLVGTYERKTTQWVHHLHETVLHLMGVRGVGWFNRRTSIAWSLAYFNCNYLELLGWPITLRSDGFTMQITKLKIRFNAVFWIFFKFEKFVLARCNLSLKNMNLLSDKVRVTRYHIVNRDQNDQRGRKVSLNKLRGEVDNSREKHPFTIICFVNSKSAALVM